MSIISSGLNAEEWARAQGCTTPEVLPFSTQAYRYTRFSDNCSSTRSKNDAAHSRSLSPARNRLSVSSTSKSDKHDRGRRMSQIPPRMIEKKSAPGKVKRGSLPTIKFTGLFSTKQSSSSDGVQNKDDRKQKSSQYCVQSGSVPRVTNSKSTSSSPRRTGENTRVQMSHGNLTIISPSKRRQCRTSSQSDMMEPTIPIKSTPQSCQSMDRNSSLDCENSIATLSLVDCSKSKT